MDFSIIKRVYVIIKNCNYVPNVSIILVDEINGGDLIHILILGGTRFFGIPMVDTLIRDGHKVTIATRGKTKDNYGTRVDRIILDRKDPDSLQKTLTGKYYDVVIDKIAYCSNDIRNIMDVIDCGLYICMSSTAVYEPKRMNTKEEYFDGADGKIIWCDQADYCYAEIKRQAEKALRQVYADRKWIAVRYPFVIGKGDYTKRLLFYVEHTMKSIPMYIDDLDCQMGYIHCKEAGEFIAYLAEQYQRDKNNYDQINNEQKCNADSTNRKHTCDFYNNLNWSVNGASHGTISIRQIISYVEQKTGSKAVLSETGELAPYNGEVAYSINTERAESTGFQFSNLNDWIYELIDYYIGIVNEEA